MSKLDPHTLDDGIREIVLLLRKAGYKTFTSCEGGRGHSFREPTIGLTVQGDYFRFRDRLVKFLHSQGRSCFEVVLFSCYHPDTPQGKHHAYLQGFDIVSPEKRKKLIRSSRQKERRTIVRLLKELHGGGRAFDSPPSRDIRTFKRAPRASRKSKEDQVNMFN